MSAYSGLELNLTVLTILGSGLLVLILSALLIRQRNLKNRLKQLRNAWGKIPQNRLDIESAKIFFELNAPGSTEHEYRLDKDTWSDLDLDDIFAIVNRTTTPVGGQCLYHLLRHPVLKEETLNDREQLIERFSNDQSLREQIQLHLNSLGGMNAKYLPYLLWQPLPARPAYAGLLPFLSSLSILALPAVVFGFLHFSALIVIFAVNLAIRHFVKRKIDAFIYSFQYLGLLISTAKRLSSLKLDNMTDLQDSLKSSLEKTAVIEKKIYALRFDDSLGVMEYLNIYFLWDITGFYSAIKKIKQQMQPLRNLYKTVGYLDAMISIASFRLEYDQFCRPSFSSTTERFKVDSIYNPLLKEPVVNSFEFSVRDYFVTGSNMAGKTTFIKTIGVNAVLAQTINTCLARKYEAPLITVISSIGREDNLLLGKSYYMAEIESILRLIRASESDTVHLFILDEIFRGTNSVERHAVSIEVLKYLANKKDFVLVATHDLQLSKALVHEYRNVHFQEEVSDDGLTFDYLLHPGSSTTRNAIALLKHIGYPNSIIENATNSIGDRGM